ncbi:hypothetical protein OK016_00520 [Vibrio chagasii]|nr:hypothetical protein [Vibrio chagasii]
MKSRAQASKQSESRNFSYSDLPETQMLTAYERLLLDALNGDATHQLLHSTDAVEACWKYVQPIARLQADLGTVWLWRPAGPTEADANFCNVMAQRRFHMQNLTGTVAREL